MKKYLLFLLLISVPLFSCSKNQPEPNENNPIIVPQPNPPSDPSDEAITVEQPRIWWRLDSSDLIGPDLPAVEYIAVAYPYDKTGRFELYEYNDDSGKMGNLLIAEDFEIFTTFTPSGYKEQMLISKDMIIYRSEDLAPKEKVNDSYILGIYLIGEDMPSGTYQVRANKNAVKDGNYLAIMNIEEVNGIKSVTVIRKEILDPQGEPITVTFEDGQTVFLNYVTAKKTDD